LDNKTEKGLLLLIIGMLISIFSTLITVATGTLEGSELSSGSCLSSALGFFGLIFLFVGWVLMISARKDYGDKHSKFVMYSIAALVIGFIIVVVSVAIITVSLLSGGFASTGDEVTLDYPEVVRSMKGGLMVGQLGGIFVTLGAILLVYCLENETGKMVLYIALAASIIIAIVAMVVISTTMDKVADRLEDTPEEQHEDEFNEGLEAFGIIDALGVISTFLLIIGYYIPYDRIKKGELKRIPPPTQPYGIPPPQPPYPDMYQPPQYPPPQYPPPMYPPPR
jgi:magnesium-transporting ATPase (P-type)